MSQLFTSGGQSIEISTSVLPNEYSGMISFRIDWFDLLAVQGTLKSSPAPHCESIFQFSSVQLISVAQSCQLFMTP